jgi:hypothetical protein
MLFRPEPKPKAHLVAGAFWWIEADGRIALRSLSGGEARLFTDVEIRPILDAVEDATGEPLLELLDLSGPRQATGSVETPRRRQAV